MMKRCQNAKISDYESEGQGFESLRARQRESLSPSQKEAVRDFFLFCRDSNPTDLSVKKMCRRHIFSEERRSRGPARRGGQARHVRQHMTKSLRARQRESLSPSQKEAVRDFFYFAGTRTRRI